MFCFIIFFNLSNGAVVALDVRFHSVHITISLKIQFELYSHKKNNKTENIKAIDSLEIFIIIIIISRIA